MRQITREDKVRYERALTDIEESIKEVDEVIKSAREEGDLSENAAYETGINKKSELVNRRDKLRDLINNSKVVLTENVDRSLVNLNTTVTLRREDTKETYTYEFVGEGNGNVLENKISRSSILGDAVYRKPVGTEVSIRDMMGDLVTYTVIDIR